MSTVGVYVVVGIRTHLGLAIWEKGSFCMFGSIIEGKDKGNQMLLESGAMFFFQAASSASTQTFPLQFQLSPIRNGAFRIPS